MEKTKNPLRGSISFSPFLFESFQEWIKISTFILLYKHKFKNLEAGLTDFKNVLDCFVIVVYNENRGKEERIGYMPVKSFNEIVLLKKQIFCSG